MNTHDIHQLAKNRNDAQDALRKAEKEHVAAHKQFEEAKRVQKQKCQQEQYANDAKEAVANTSLPKWLVAWIEYKADEDGHSAGQSEVDMLTFSMIYDVEDWKRKHEQTS